MKNIKIITLSSVVLTIVFLSGCQSTQTVNPEEVRLSNFNQEKRIGIIQSLGSVLTSTKATHLLSMTDGKTIYLKSSDIDLGSDKFVKIEVEVSGNLIRTTDGNQVMDVKSIDLLEKDQKTQNAQPQWLNYNSDNLGLSLKYRDDYKLVSQDNAISIKGLPQSQKNLDSIDANKPAELENSLNADQKLGVEISIKLISADTNFDLLNYLNLLSDNSSELLTKGFSKSKITLRALDALKKASNDGTAISYYIKTNGKTYEINFKADLTESLIQDQNIFYDILATVDFKGQVVVNPPLNKSNSSNAEAINKLDFTSANSLKTDKVKQ